VIGFAGDAAAAQVVDTAVGNDFYEEGFGMADRRSVDLHPDKKGILHDILGCFDLSQHIVGDRELLGLFLGC
jgi:hypothetical protein